jgi:simple sugar transport system permease protein
LRGALVAVAIFGVADAVELRLQAFGGVPREVWIAALLLVLALGAGARLRAGRPRRPGPALIGCLVALAALAVTSPRLNVPVPLWLALPYVLALAALAGDGKRRHRPPAALAVPYRRSEA